jgi:methylase of polypeptide subunit release factors
VAIKFSQVNAKLQEVQREGVTFAKCHMLQGLRGEFNLIVSNPHFAGTNLDSCHF